MTIADKLVYLNETKQLLKSSIKSLGYYLDSDTPFRQYVMPLLEEATALLSDFSGQRHKLYEDQSGLDVVTDGLGFDDVWDITRGSTATYFNRLGIIAEAGINEARTTHDPSSLNSSVTEIDLDEVRRKQIVEVVLEDVHSFSEGDTLAFTDEANENNFFYGTVVRVGDSSSELTLRVTSKAGTGLIGNWVVIKSLGLLIEGQRTRLNTIAAAPTAPESVTVAAVEHTISFFGTGSVTLSGVATGELVGAGANSRVTLTFTPTAGTLTLTPSGAVTDLQLEARVPGQATAFATSVIRGEGSQVTRAADNAIRAIAGEVSVNGFAIFCEFESLSGVASDAGVFTISAGVQNTGISLRKRNTTQSSVILRTESGLNFVDLAVPINSGKHKAAISITKSGGVSFAVDGQYSGQVSTNVLDYSSLIENIYLGKNTTTGEGNATGYTADIIKKFVLIPRALSEAELIALTAPEA